MVGRLVQQQDVGLLHPRLRQRDTLFLPAGQIGDFFVFRQPQFADGLAHQRVELPAVLRFDLVLQFVQFFDEAVVLPVRQFAADFVVTPQHAAQAAQPFGHNVEYGGCAVEKALLRHIHGFQPVLQDELAVVGLLHAGEDFQQAGFARAVAPDEPDFIARGQLERRFVEQRNVPEGEG